jgi:hypothetical protein
MKIILQIAFAILGLAAPALNAPQVTTIRQIDFDNFSYSWSDPPENVPETWHWLTSTPHSRFTTVNGIHHFYSPGEDEKERRFAPLVSVDSTYGDLDGDGVEEAAVALNHSSGGTANWDYLYVTFTNLKMLERSSLPA